MDWYCEKLHCWMTKTACLKRRNAATNKRNTDSNVFKDAGCATCLQIKTRKPMNENPTEKRCKKCGIIKPFSEFHKHSQCKYGIDNRCKACKHLMTIMNDKRKAMDTSEITSYQESQVIMAPVKIVHEAERGPKETNGKPNWAVFPFSEAEAVVKVFENGANKYGAPFTYRKGIPQDELWSAIMRHLIEIQNGNDTDTESGCLHLAHIAANALMALSSK